MLPFTRVLPGSCYRTSRVAHHTAYSRRFAHVPIENYKVTPHDTTRHDTPQHVDTPAPHRTTQHTASHHASPVHFSLHPLGAAHWWLQLSSVKHPQHTHHSTPHSSAPRRPRPSLPAQLTSLRSTPALGQGAVVPHHRSTTHLVHSHWCLKLSSVKYSCRRTMSTSSTAAMKVSAQRCHAGPCGRS